MAIVASTENVKGELMTLYIETDIAAVKDPTAVYSQAETREEARKLSGPLAMSSATDWSWRAAGR